MGILGGGDGPLFTRLRMLLAFAILLASFHPSSPNSHANPDVIDIVNV